MEPIASRKVLDHGLVALVRVDGADRDPAHFARTSFRNSDADKTAEEDHSLCDFLVRHRHTSPIEFVEAVFYMKMPIFVARQLIRHRTAVVNEESMRYIKACEEIYIPAPHEFHPRPKNVKQGSDEDRTVEDPALCEKFWKHAVNTAKAGYNELLASGVAPELARGVLPLAQYTAWYWKCDLNNIGKLLALRTARHAQSHTRAYATAMFEVLQEALPRLMASIDQEEKSEYNQQYVAQAIHAEEIEEMQIDMADILDLPQQFGPIYAGMDVGLTISPTVIVLFSKEKVEGRERLKMIRMYHLWRLRPKQIRETLYALTYHLGKKLISFGMDVTGLGFPMFQEMEDDEAAPRHLLDVSRGYFFNASVPVGINADFITEDDRGNKRDQYGAAVKEETDPLSGEKRFVSMMPMIEASTRYVRDWIDTGRLLLPFDQEVRADMQGETHQRVKAVGEKRGKKPNAFHILDAMRAAAMAEKAESIEEAIANEEQEEVLDMVG